MPPPLDDTGPPKGCPLKFRKAQLPETIPLPNSPASLKSGEFIPWVYEVIIKTSS